MSNRFQNGIRYLPTLPSVLQKLLATLDDPDSTASDLERILANDQSLAAKILSVANSAYYGFKEEIVTVRRAVVVLGFNEVRNLCLGATLMGYLSPQRFRAPRAMEQLWLHALATAEAGKLLAQRAGRPAPDRAYSAGLLHDLGKVVAAALFPDQEAKLRDVVLNRGISSRQAEKELDLDHTELGREFGLHWELPAMLCQVMGGHHGPTKLLCQLPEVANAHLADVMANQIHLGDSGNYDPLLPDPRALEYLGMSAQDFAACRALLKEHREAVETIWRFLIATT